MLATSGVKRVRGLHGMGLRLRNAAGNCQIESSPYCATTLIFHAAENISILPDVLWPCIDVEIRRWTRRAIRHVGATGFELYTHSSQSAKERFRFGLL